METLHQRAISLRNWLRSRPPMPHAGKAVTSCPFCRSDAGLAARRTQSGLEEAIEQSPQLSGRQASRNASPAVSRRFAETLRRSIALAVRTRDLSMGCRSAEAVRAARVCRASLLLAGPSKLVRRVADRERCDDAKAESPSPRANRAHMCPREAARRRRLIGDVDWASSKWISPHRKDTSAEARERMWKSDVGWRSNAT
eukprot:6201052-Pleurochrysis_carterae.AAC.4